MEKYDIFLSHAIEDKDFTTPLADNLKSLGLEVWYDVHDLNKSKQLGEDLDNGLKRSNFGVIVLSKNYFTKGWTRLELDAWINLLVYSKKAIITIWHEVNVHDVIAFSPMISTINAFPSTMDIKEISKGIYDIVRFKDTKQYTDFGSNSRYKNTDPKVREIQNKRFRALLRLYQLRDRQTLRDKYAVGNEMGYDKSTLDEILNYYLDKSFIEYPSIGNVEITVWGMDHVENLMKDNIDVKTVQSNRNAVLMKLYNTRTQTQGLDMWELGEELGFSNQKATFDIMYYLKIKTLIDCQFKFIWITTEGIDYVENNLF